ncbi:MAG: SCO family protein [Gammaproteobacteria bacterium]|nr:SCO family protein [Gammaproteobacteria bacterium]
MRQLIPFPLMVATFLLSFTVFAVEIQPAPEGGSIQKFQYKAALTASQDAIGNQLSDFRLTDATGRGLLLSDLRGKPLVLSLIYTSCYQICPMTTRHLAKVVEKARDTLGKDSFSVAMLGFDTQFDDPQAMQHFARKHGVDDADWHLLSADPETIQALTKELGFLFFSSPNGFDHVVQASVIDADGEVYRQVYGEVFDTPLLVEPLKELVLGRPQPNQTLVDDLINRVRFFCTNYDPASDSYHFDYSLFIGMFIGALIIILGTAFVIREYYHGRRLPPA